MVTKHKTPMTRVLLLTLIVVSLLGAGILAGCRSRSGQPSESREPGSTDSRQGESGSEHGGRSEGSESGGEHGAGSSEAGGEEGSGTQLAPDETFDMVRSGARLILSYDAASKAFVGTVENTTNNVLTRVRIEVHLSDGTELGPTTPNDLSPGQKVPVNLPLQSPHSPVG